LQRDGIGHLAVERKGQQALHENICVAQLSLCFVAATTRLRPCGDNEGKMTFQGIIRSGLTISSQA
jgi:hypothetical protein